MKKRKTKDVGHKALGAVRQFFPDVKIIEDAKATALIEVTPKDNSSSAVKDHHKCALAVACKRALRADGVLIGTRTAYVVRGERAHRFRLNESASREIVSFDRNAGFAPGIYMLRPPSKAEQLGARQTGKTRHPSGRKKPAFRHYTKGVRTVLGGLAAA